VLGPGHPCGDDAALLVSELFGDSVRHSRSGAAGGTVTVAVGSGDGFVRVEVTDRSGPKVPELCSAGRDAEGGRGLQPLPLQDGELVAQEQDLSGLPSFLTPGQPQP
jgi:anti-sigma regulatory factor (Ser/Thr protein kinase)